MRKLKHSRTAARFVCRVPAIALLFLIAIAARTSANPPGPLDLNFLAPFRSFAVPHPGPIVVGDINGDAYPDMIVGSYNSDSGSVFIAVGNGSFVRRDDVGIG